MAADIVGYSRLIGRDEAGTLAAIRMLRQELIDPLLAEHHGRIVKLMGDGLLVEFGSVVDAVACAVELQKAGAVRQVEVPPERRIVLRIGINLGDVVVDGEDLLGDGVNVAARLEQLCAPGSVLISGTAFDHLQGKLDLPLRFTGERQLKNIERPVRTYEVWLDGACTGPSRSPARRSGWMLPAAAMLVLLLALAAGGTWWLWFRPPDVPERPSLAVLPFDNLGGDEATGRLADGITEDIITDLARFRDLDVIARNSTEAYRAKAVDVRQIGKDLSVRYALEGSIQRQGNRVRVTAQLVDTGSGAHVWSERWDRPTEDIFAVQAEVAEAVAGAIGGGTNMAALTASAIAQARRRPPTKLTAYDHYLLAVDGKAKRTKESVVAGLEHADAAIAQDPELARAYATRAYLRFFAVAWSGDLPGALQGMEADAKRAVELDPRDAEAQAALAFAYALTGRLPEAEAEVTRAIAENPANIHVLVIAANIVPFVEPGPTRRVPDGSRLDHTGAMADWMLDELAHAGAEHLDAAYVAGYEAKAGYDPTADVERLQQLGLDASSTVVDLGAGTGVFTAAVSPHCSRVVAVDVSPAMIDDAPAAGGDAQPRQRRRRPSGIHDLRARRRARRTSSSPATRCTSCPTSGRASPWPGSPRCYQQVVTCGSTTSSSTSSRRRPTRGSRHGWPAPSTTRRGVGPPTSSPSTSAPSSARIAGCSSRCSSASASRSSTASTGVAATGPTPVDDETEAFVAQRPGYRRAGRPTGDRRKEFSCARSSPSWPSPLCRSRPSPATTTTTATSTTPISIQVKAPGCRARTSTRRSTPWTIDVVAAPATNSARRVSAVQDAAASPLTPPNAAMATRGIAVGVARRRQRGAEERERPDRAVLVEAGVHDPLDRRQQVPPLGDDVVGDPVRRTELVGRRRREVGVVRGLRSRLPDGHGAPRRGPSAACSPR